MTTHETVETVVAAGLCMGCGTCVRACATGAITMAETPGGLLLARVEADKCTSCGICAKVCPGWHLEKGFFSPDVDPFKGQVLAAYCAQATDRDLVADAQSGGAVTALLCHLLDAGHVTRAAVTEMPRDGTLRPRTIVAANGEGMNRARGSKYCPVAVNAALPESRKGSPEKTAIVVLGCHMQGLRNAQANGLPWAQDIALTVGLFCDRVLSYGAIDYLVDKAGVPIDKALGFEYRSKRWRGWPGDVCVRTRGGEDRYLDKHYRSLCKEFFTLARCRLCFDKCNVFSDLTFGDAWGVRQAVEGFSVILARTPKGLDMLLSAEKAGALRLEKIAPEVVFKAQGAENRRRNWTAYTAVWQQMGRAAPDFGIASRWWASLDQVDLAPFRRHLERAMDLSSRASRDEVVNVAKRNLFLPGILWLFRKVCRKLSPRRVAWAVWRRARRILAK